MLLVPWQPNQFCPLQKQSKVNQKKNYLITFTNVQPKKTLKHTFYRVFQGFGRAKFPDGGSILDSS